MTHKIKTLGLMTESSNARHPACLYLFLLSSRSHWPYFCAAPWLSLRMARLRTSSNLRWCWASLRWQRECIRCNLWCRFLNPSARKLFKEEISQSRVRGPEWASAKVIEERCGEATEGPALAEPPKEVAFS